MESSFTKLYYHKLQRLRYFNSRSKTKTFIQRFRRKNQRLIPLTREIQKAMMDFNGSESSISDLERVFPRSLSLSTAAREEEFNMLREFISDQFVRKRDIGKIIEKCVAEKMTEIQGATDDKIEKNMEDMTEDTNVNTLIIKSINRLEHRVNFLETNIIKNVRKLRHVRVIRYKIKTNSNKEKLNVLPKLDALTEKDEQYCKINESIDTNSTEEAHNMYDDTFYSTREYTMNLLNYKKSLESLELNQKPQWNPYVRPIIVRLPPQEKYKRCSMFLPICDKNCL